MRPENFEATNGPSSPGGDTPSAGGSSGIGAKAQQTAQRLKESALDTVSEAREKADSQKQDLVNRVRRVSSALRDAGESLRGEDDLAARCAGFVADGVEQAASYVSSMNPRDIARDVQEFARRKPAVFFGGAFLLGLAAGRFLKSSQERRWESERDWDESYGAGEEYPEYTDREESWGYEQPASAGAYRTTSRSVPTHDIFDTGQGSETDTGSRTGEATRTPETMTPSGGIGSSGIGGSEPQKG